MIKYILNQLVLKTFIVNFVELLESLLFILKNEISEDSIANFYYNILIKDFEKGKLIKINSKIENILLALKEESSSDDPKIFL